MRLLRKFRPPVQKWTTTVEGACLRPRPPVPPHARSGWSRCFLTPTVWTSLSWKVEKGRARCEVHLVYTVIL